VPPPSRNPEMTILTISACHYLSGTLALLVYDFDNNLDMKETF